uniref:Uncharacterized protein n=1 Tax=Physcomitrium patens TaxID=3218 RepID=A0A2K1J071_PHYPA|nr:hypothetical protein PHYPA_022823 [Physcomitrium patens]
MVLNKSRHCSTRNLLFCCLYLCISHFKVLSNYVYIYLEKLVNHKSIKVVVIVPSLIFEL